MAALHEGILELGAFEALAGGDTPLHRVDPRAKLIATIAFLATVVSWGRYEIAGLVPLAAFPLFLCAAGRVPLRVIGKKLLVVAPFVLVLGAFNPLFDTAPREIMDGVTVRGGLLSYGSIALRFVLTVSAALTLVAVTGMNPLCAAAGKLGAPRIFVTQLALLYRYLFVLAAEALRMSRAAALRAPGRGRRSLKEFGSLVGHLLLRTLDRAARIHLAMRCRGFHGHVPMLRPMRFKASDAAFLVVWLTFFGAVRLLQLPDLLGRLATGAFL
jgi:cobalt/nickel transport system permease protein